MLTAALVALPAPARAARCKEQCEAERKRIKKKLADCLEETKLMQRSRAVVVRRECLKKYVAPDCSGLPACPRQEQTKYTPQLRLGSLTFSAVKRGPRLKNPRFRAGGEMFCSLALEVTSKPKANQIWIQADLRLLTRPKKGPGREVVRWNNYLQQRKPLDPDERSTPKKYTLHGGAKLPPGFDPGPYLAEMVVRERISDFSGKAQAPFRVSRAAGNAPPRKGSSGK